MDALTAPPLVRFGFGRRMGIAAARPVEGARPTAAAEIPWLSEPPATATGLTALREDREAKPPAGDRGFAHCSGTGATAQFARVTPAPFRERPVWFWTDHFGAARPARPPISSKGHPPARARTLEQDGPCRHAPPGDATVPRQCRLLRTRQLVGRGPSRTERSPARKAWRSSPTDLTVPTCRSIRGPLSIRAWPISPRARYRQRLDIAQGTVCTVLPRREVRTRLAVTSNAVTGVRNNEVLPLSRGRGSARGRSGSASVRLSDKLYSPLPCVRHDDLMFEFFDGTNWPPSYGAAGPGPRHADHGASEQSACPYAGHPGGRAAWSGGSAVRRQ
jgi:hypothetical protein